EAEPATSFDKIVNQITIQTELMKEGWVRIRIQDNGPGIPETVKAKIFEHLFTTKGVGKGTGLGLSISRQIIVEKHGGRLDCVSEAGQGTAFVIEIPIA
ncbi:MAG: HAMP domain-containing histidine kinase, partial [Oculatellaceae cyanobacterium Prado106]|nr:HAMP domain-containing histidine kinase [Oculatellaceae cyanobacterium Prado106]